MSIDEPETDEQDLAAKLASFDEALKDGSVNGPLDAPELSRAQACLRMLEDIWPRHANNAPTELQPLLAEAARPLTVSAMPTTVGRFRILRELGRGGFGIVYLAHDAQLNRDVALKVPRPDALVSPELRIRFEQEARAAAGLNHPNLVPVFETGEDGGVCWIVSAYCPSINLAEWLRQQSEPVPFRDAAQLVATAARAVQHAHECGVLHRDLKPANILLQFAEKNSHRIGEPALLSSCPLSKLSPRITDFGLAKLVDADVHTRSGATLGTPAYMAPEQAMRSGAAVGPTIDVYSLGIILYELLTGRAPFVAESPLEILMLAQKEEPLPPNRLRHRLPRDLETICLKCLHKEPARRYESARDLAADLERYLAGEPIKARPVGLFGRAARWARRNPDLAAMAALLSIALVVGVAGIGWQWWRADRNADRATANAAQAVIDRDLAQIARQKETDALDRHRIMRAYDEWLSDNTQAARDLLRDAGNRKESWEWRYVNRLCALGVARFDDHQTDVTGIAFARDGRTLLSLGRDGTLFVRDVVEGKSERIAIPTDRPEDFTSFSLSSADSRYLAFGTASGFVHIWDVVDRSVITSWKAHDAGTNLRVAFSPDGRFLATSLGTTAKTWDFHRRKELRTFSMPSFINRIAWSADGRYLAGCGGFAHQVRIWDAVSGKEAITLPTVLWMASCVAFSPDNSRFAWSGMDGIVAIHETTPKFPRAVTMSGLPGLQACIEFSPDGRFIAAGSASGPVKIWNIETSQLVATLHGHSSGVRDLAFSADGSLLATIGFDRKIIVWDILDQQEVHSLVDFVPGRLYSTSFSPDSQTMATAIRQLRLWDLKQRKTVHSSPDLAGLGTAFHPNGRQFAGGDNSGTVRVISTDKREIARHRMAGYPIAMKYVDSGRRLLVAGWENAVHSWSPGSNESPQMVVGPLAHAGRGVRIDDAAAFSPDGRWFAYAERGQPPSLWDLQSREKILTFDEAPTITTALAFHAAGEHLAIGNYKGQIQIHEVKSGRVAATLSGHAMGIVGLAFTPDGSRLASTSRDGVVKLWDPLAAVEVLSLRGHATFDTSVAFSPDGQLLVVGGWDGFVRMWSTRDPGSEPPETRTARRRDWHQRQAEDANKNKRWFSARHHWGQLISLEPAQWTHRLERGRACAEIGDWEAAATDFDAVLADPDRPFAVYEGRASLYLRSGDIDGYRHLTKRMLDRFATPENLADTNNVVWLCLLTNPTTIDANRLVHFSELALSKAKNATERLLTISTLGAALYRANRIDDAIKRLNEAVTNQAQGGFPEDWLFLALAHQRKGNKEKAKECFGRTSPEFEKALAGLNLADGRRGTWTVRAQFEAIRREAAAALGIASP